MRFQRPRLVCGHRRRHKRVLCGNGMVFVVCNKCCRIRDLSTGKDYDFDGWVNRDRP